MAVGACFSSSLVLLANEPSSDGDKNTAQTAADVVAFAQEIDQLVADELKKRSQAPRPKIDDYTFCRRVYLEAIFSQIPPPLPPVRKPMHCPTRPECVRAGSWAPT